MRIDQYLFQIDWNRDQTYTHPDSNLSAYFLSAIYHYGQTAPYQDVAPTARMTVVVNNENGDFNPELSGARFNGLWKHGILGRLVIQYWDNGGNYLFRILFAGVLKALIPDTDPHAPQRTAVLVFEDAGQFLVDMETYMPLMQAVDTGSAIVFWAREGNLPFPYPHNFWMLDVQGSSNLDQSTMLVNESALKSIQGGNTVLRWLGDAHDRGNGANGAQFIRDVVSAEMGGRFWYHAPATGYYFRNRNNYINIGSVAFTLSSEIVSNPPPVYRYFENIINKVEVTYTPREVDFSAPVVFRATRGIKINAGETKTVNARFTDPNRADARIAALNPIPPVAYTDYMANSDEFGGGTDLTQYMLVGLEYTGQKATFHITNQSGTPAWMTLLQLRTGIALRTYNTETISRADPFSIALHGEHRASYNVRMIDSMEVAEQYAQSILKRFAYPHGSFERVSMYLSVENNIIPYTVDTICAVNHPYIQTAVGTKYRIAGESAQIDAITNTHLQTWVLEPVDAAIYFVLDDPTRSALDSTAVLAF